MTKSKINIIKSAFTFLLIISIGVMDVLHYYNQLATTIEIVPLNI